METRKIPTKTKTRHKQYRWETKQRLHKGRKDNQERNEKI